MLNSAAHSFEKRFFVVLRVLPILIILGAGCPQEPIECLQPPCTGEEDTDSQNPPDQDAGATTAMMDAGETSPPVSDAGHSPANPAQDAGQEMTPTLADGGSSSTDCIDTCELRNWVCGVVCDTSCGTCGSTETCAAGGCYSENILNACPQCSLQLVVTDQTITNGLVTAVTLAVDYEPTATEPTPRMIDLYLTADETAQPLVATEGAALITAGKSLTTDSATGNAWLSTPSGDLRFFAFSAGNTNHIEAGRLFEISFLVSPGQAGLAFALVKREENFAPPEADAALYGQSYDAPVVILANP